MDADPRHELGRKALEEMFGKRVETTAREQIPQKEAEANKGYGNSFTTPRDVTEMDYGRQVLLSLCETVGMRLRRDGQAGACMTVHLRSSSFENWSHQKQRFSSVS